MIYLFVIIGILACSCSQVLLKTSALKNHTCIFGALFDWRILVAYCIMLSSIVINIYAMRAGIGLKEMPILESLGYIFVPILSLVFFEEKITTKGLLSIILIISGIYVFYI